MQGQRESGRLAHIASAVPRRWWWILLASLCLNLAAFHHDTFRMFSNEILTGLTGPKPFQGRILTFWLAGLLRPLVPADWLVNTQDYLFIVLDALSLLGAAVLVWRLVEERAGLRWGLWALFLLFWQVVWTYVATPGLTLYWPYDWPSMFFMTAFIWAVFHPQPWARLAILMLLATLNRETAILMLAVLVAGRLAFWQQEWPIWCGLLLIWLACRWGIGCYLQGNPGQALTLYHNDDPSLLRFWRNLGQLAVDRENANPWHVLSAFGGLWLLVPWRQWLRRWPNAGLWLGILLAYLLLLLVVGNLDEPRIWGEFIPMMALLVSLGWCQRARSTTLVHVPQSPLPHRLE